MVVQRFLSYSHDLWPGAPHGLWYEPWSVSLFAVSIPLCEQGQPAVSRLYCGCVREWWSLWALPLHRGKLDQKGQGPSFVELGSEFWAERIAGAKTLRGKQDSPAAFA